MGELIYIDKFLSKRNKKQKEKIDDKTKQQYRDSLNNEEVKKRYKIKEPTLQEREQKIKERIEKINKLLIELENNNK